MPGTPHNPASDERDFLAAYDPAAFERPSVAVDVALVTVISDRLHALVLRRDAHPAKGRWSLPGGFVGPRESLDAAAQRVVAQKANLRGIFAEQLYTFGAVNRDPRTRIISVAYYALVDAECLDRAIEDTPDLKLARINIDWEGEVGGPATLHDVDGAPLTMAFDHADIVGMTVKRLRGKVDYAPIGFELLPPTFTLRRLQTVHEAILGRELNKDAFRRRLLATGALEPTGTHETEVGHRPAELYRVVARAPS